MLGKGILSIIGAMLSNATAQSFIHTQAAARMPSNGQASAPDRYHNMNNLYRNHPGNGARECARRVKQLQRGAK